MRKTLLTKEFKATLLAAGFMAAIVTTATTLANGCGTADEVFDCQSVCTRYHDCYDSGYDVDACRQRCRPYRPVKLGVRSAVIERQTIRIHVGLIKLHFAFCHIWWEQMKPENRVPNQVVFLAPGACLIKCKPVVISIGRKIDPLACHVFCGAPVLLRGCMVTQLFCELRIGCECFDRLD